ncbi:hypothetical protein DFH29DRAFT_1006587 [Suillus ampliporus]|nr:hypothetical protein DFH29DRAFT_1006587 [Suillus ampliporus]
MSFPEGDKIYYLQSSRKPDYYASIRTGERVLRGERSNPSDYSQQFLLKYDINDADSSQAFCTLTDVGDKILLGVNSVDQFQPVYGLDRAQAWILRPANAGYSIGQLSEGREYTWTIGNEGDPIVISSGIVNAESWQFVPVPPQ